MICPSCCCCGIYSLVFLLSIGKLVSDIKCGGRFTDICHPLGVPAVASFRKQTKKKKKILQKHLVIFAFSRVCGRWGHVFATTRSANHSSWKKSGHVTLFHYCSWGSVWYFSCFGVVVGTSWWKPPSHKYRLHTLHTLASYSPPRAVNF